MVLSIEEQEREIEARQSRLKKRPLTLEEQERRLEAKQSKLKPQPKPKKKIAPSTAFTLEQKWQYIPPPVISSRQTAPIKKQSFFARPIEIVKKVPTTIGKGIKKGYEATAKVPIFIDPLKRTTRSISIHPTLQPLLGTAQITPNLKHAIDLTGVPYITKELTKFKNLNIKDWDDIQSNYIRGVAGVAFPPFLVDAIVSGATGEKPIITPTMADEKRHSRPFGNILFASKEKQEFLKGKPMKSHFWARLGGAWRPIDAILTFTIARGITQITKAPVKKLLKRNETKQQIKAREELTNLVTNRFYHQGGKMNGATRMVDSYLPLKPSQLKYLKDPLNKQALDLHITANLSKIGTPEAKAYMKTTKDGRHSIAMNDLLLKKLTVQDFVELGDNLPPARIKELKALEKKGLNTFNNKLKYEEHNKKTLEDLKQDPKWEKLEQKLENDYNKQKIKEQRELENLQKDIDNFVLPKSQKKYREKYKADQKKLKEHEKKTEELRVAQQKLQKATDDLNKELEVIAKAKKDKEYNEFLKRVQKQRIEQASKIEKELKEDVDKMLEELTLGGVFKIKPPVKPKGEIPKGEPPKKATQPDGTETKFETDPKSSASKSTGIGIASPPKKPTPATPKPETRPLYEKPVPKLNEMNKFNNNPTGLGFLQAFLPKYTSGKLKIWGNQEGEIAISPARGNEPIYQLQLKLEQGTVTADPINTPKEWKNITSNEELKNYPVVVPLVVPNLDDIPLKIPLEIPPTKQPKKDKSGMKVEIPKKTTTKLPPPSKEEVKERVKLAQELNDFFLDIGFLEGDPTKTPVIVSIKVPEKIKVPKRVPSEKKEEEKTGVKVSTKVPPPKDDTPPPTKPKPKRKLKLPKRKKQIENIKLKNQKEYPYLVSWLQGNQYPVANLLNNKVRYTRIRPRNLKKGNTVAQTFTVLKASKETPRTTRLDIGKFFANIGRGGVSFELKKRNIIKPFKY